MCMYETDLRVADLSLPAVRAGTLSAAALLTLCRHDVGRVSTDIFLPEER